MPGRRTGSSAPGGAADDGKEGIMRGFHGNARRGAATPGRAQQACERDCWEELTTSERIWQLRALAIWGAALSLAATAGALLA